MEAIILLILNFSTVPALIQIAACLLARSSWTKSIPIILMSLFWIANVIMNHLFSSPPLEEYATFYLSSGSLIRYSDQAWIAYFGIFAIAAQALVWLIVSLIQRNLRNGK